VEKEYSVTNSVFFLIKKIIKKWAHRKKKDKQTNKSAPRIVTIAYNMKGRLRFSTFIF